MKDHMVVLGCLVAMITWVPHAPVKTAAPAPATAAAAAAAASTPAAPGGPDDSTSEPGSSAETKEIKIEVKKAPEGDGCLCCSWLPSIGVCVALSLVYPAHCIQPSTCYKRQHCVPLLSLVACSVLLRCSSSLDGCQNKLTQSSSLTGKGRAKAGHKRASGFFTQ